MSVDLSIPVVLPSYENLLLTLGMEQDAGVATVTLNRPQLLNALNRRTLDELEQVFHFLAQDPTVRVILITGSGEKAFAAGADINELTEMDEPTAKALALRGQSVFSLISASTRPVIACINGFALGGGSELALACTLRLAAATAKLGQPEVKLGLFPGYGGTQRLPRLVGPSAALKLILTGEMISAQEALRIGLVDEVLPAAELLPRALAIARQIAAQAPLAIAATLEAVHRGLDLPLAGGLALEASLFGQLGGSADKQEGVTAFLEKRKPHFQGR